MHCDIMAESDTTSGASWWGDLVTSIKQQSEQALRATQRDLSELVTTVQTDTNSFVGGATTQLTNFLWSKDDNSDDTKETSDAKDVPVKEKQIKPELDHELCKEPNHPDFKQWSESFTLEQYTDQISELLAESSEVRGLHSSFVPALLSNIDFWKRYFFHQYLKEQEQLQKQKLMIRADASSDSSSLASWEEIDHDDSCLKDIDTSDSVKPDLKESEVDEDWISWDD